MKKPTPIFVVGMNRSGTKWLSNILCNHLDVIGVQSQRNKGIVESNVIQGIMQSKFDLSNMEDYVAFIELWANTTFFKITGADKEMFYKLDPIPDNYCKLFKILMDDYAERNSKKYWLQKMPPPQASKVMEYFDNGFFIVIKRGIVDTLKSAIVLIKEENKEIGLMKNIFFYVLEEKMIDEISAKGNVTNLRYEDLLQSPEEQIRKVCRTIGINFEPEMINVSYRKNTSFKKQVDRNTIITKTDELIIKVLSKIFGLLPLFLLKGIRKMNKSYKCGPTPLISGSLSDIRDQYTLWDYYPRYFTKIKKSRNV